MTGIGDLFTHHRQPYGTELVRIEKITPRPYVMRDFELPLGEQLVDRVCYDLHGRVVEGSETNRIFHCSSTRDTAGEYRTVYGVSATELEAGQKTSVACG